MPWLVDKFLPSIAAVVDDVVVGVEDAVRKPVVAHELPDVLDRVELWSTRRQGNDADVGRQIEPIGGVPTGLIHKDDGVGAGCDGLRDLGEVGVHGGGVAEGQDQPGADATVRTDRAEDIGRPGPLVMRRRRARAALGPTTGDLVLLTDPGLVLEPEFYRTALRSLRDLCQDGREVFLNSSMSSER